MRPSSLAAAINAMGLPPVEVPGNSPPELPGDAPAERPPETPPEYPDESPPETQPATPTERPSGLPPAEFQAAAFGANPAMTTITAPFSAQALPCRHIPEE